MIRQLISMIWNRNNYRRLTGTIGVTSYGSFSLYGNTEQNMIHYIWIILRIYNL